MSETISQLESASSANDDDIIPATQGSIGPGSGTTRGITPAQILDAGLAGSFSTVETTGAVTVASGGITVTAGGATVTGNSTITGTLGGLTGLTVASGGAAVTGNSSVNGTVRVGSASATITGTSTNAVAITGTNTNDSASAGQVGEYVSNSATVNASSGVATDVTTISLTAGDWDVTGNLVLVNGACTFTQILGWVNTTSASAPSAPNGGAFIEQQVTFTANATQIAPIGSRRYSLASTTTIYLTVLHSFTGSGPTEVSGFIGARRAR